MINILAKCYFQKEVAIWLKNTATRVVVNIILIRTRFIMGGGGGGGTRSDIRY